MFNFSHQIGILCYPTLHRNTSQLSTTIILVSGINIALSITAILGNALILVALNRETSLNPPSKLFLRCLAFSDLCVGLIVQPVSVVSLLSAVYHRWNLCRFTELLWYSLSISMVGFSLATLIAISVDRRLALLLGIRYRQVVTMKRARLIVALSLLMSIVNCAVLFTDLLVFLLYCSVMLFLWLIMPIYCYVRIFFLLRNHIQAQVTPQGQQNGISPLNLSRYKKTVSSALWIFATLVICYAPFGVMLIVNAKFDLNGHLVILQLFCNTLVYLNSSLNPMLYCWKIREVRHAVKEILGNLAFCKL